MDGIFRLRILIRASSVTFVPFSISTRPLCLTQPLQNFASMQRFCKICKKWQFFGFLSCLLFLRMGGWSIERWAKTYTSHSPVKLWILSESPKEVLSHINTVLNCSVFICYQIYAFGMLQEMVLDTNTFCRNSKNKLSKTFRNGSLLTWLLWQEDSMSSQTKLSKS